MYRFSTKQNATVCGETIEYVAAGSGAPTIVLVNGAGGPIEAWLRVFGPVAGFTSIFAYNRPGIGSSSKPTAPQVGSHMVASLHALLQKSNQRPPYVLVGHSLGGLVVNLFARLHPELVAGVVLLEATSPEDPEQMNRNENWLQRSIRSLLDRVAPQSPLVETKQVLSTVAELRNAPAFPPVPLVVVTGKKPAMKWATSDKAREARATNQKNFLHLSPLSRQIFAQKSGHFPQFSEPELIVSILKEVVQFNQRAESV